MGLCECDVTREIISVYDDELVIDSPGHAHAQERDRRHQDQQPDRDAEDLDSNGDAHARIQSAQPGSSCRTASKPRIIPVRALPREHQAARAN